MKYIKYIIDEELYDDDYECYSNEGDELPYELEHITSEMLYEEYIEDVSDDYLLNLMKLNGEGAGCRNNGKKAARNILHHE